MSACARAHGEAESIAGFFFGETKGFSCQCLIKCRPFQLQGGTFPQEVEKKKKGHKRITPFTMKSFLIANRTDKHVEQVFRKFTKFWILNLT